MTYEQENDAVLHTFMENTFYKGWKAGANERQQQTNPGFFGNYASLELGLNDICDLSCKYCYMEKFGKEYYPNKELRNPQKILANCRILFDWLWDNRFHPDIDIFSGDALVQNIGHDVIELILDYVESGKRITHDITVPTNMGVLFHPEKVVRLESNMARAEKLGVKLHLSASVDGKFMEENRPFKNAAYYKRDDDFYHKLFTFAKKHRLGFHPMVYSEGIERWKENFLWFQSKFAEYGINWTNLYLLEIRNQEWSEAQCRELYKFCRWLVRWTWDKCDHDAKKFGTGHFFNIMSSVIHSIGRGVGCSIQSSIQTRMGDLTWSLCHRLMYEKFVAGKFNVVDGKITGVSATNLEAMLGVMTTVTRNWPYCETCVLQQACYAGCLGSNFESTGDMFTTPPTVCRMEHWKAWGLLDGLQDIGRLTDILSVLPEVKRTAITEILKGEHSL